MTIRDGIDAAEAINSDNIQDIVSAAAVDNKFGSDDLFGTGGNDTLDGGFQDDMLYGDAGADTLYGRSGEDTFIGGAGADKMYGDIGEDIFMDQISDLAGDQIDGGIGLDTLLVDLGNQTSGVTFTAADPTKNTTIYGAKVTNVEQFQVTGSDYADTLTGGHWRDTLFGNSGNDKLNGDGGSDYLDGGDGNDILSGGQGDDYMSGGGNDDQLTGSYGDDSLSGGAGNDSLDGGNGSDALYGEDGNDILVGGAGDDYILAGNGNDTIESGSGDDYIVAGDGIDKVNAGSGNDDILMTIGFGKDTIDGGSGTDLIEITGLSGVFTAKAANLVNTLSDGSTIVNIEAYSLKGSNGADTFTTLGGNDSISAENGNDTVKAGAGNDFVYGGLGDDKLYGEDGNDLLDAGGLDVDGNGKDTLYGGAGTDTAVIDLRQLASNVTFSISGNKATLSNGTTATDVEIFDIRTGDGNDVLTAGTATRVSFDAGAGNDRLTGGKGDDLLDGDLGNDTVDGGDGNDTIYDMGGNNTLNGGAGNDKVRVDVFNSSAGGDKSVVTLGSGNDSLDFNTASGGINGVLEANGGSGTDMATIDRSDSTKNLTFTLAAHAVLVNGNVTLDAFEQVSIRAGSGNDMLTGGALNDTFAGNAGNDTLSGGDGNDWLDGGTGSDTLSGGAGNDHLYGGNIGANDDGVADNLSAGSGNDEIYIGSNDTAVGASGTDTVHLDLSALNTGVTFNFTNDTVKVNATTTFSSMEKLDFDGTAGNDTVNAGSSTDVLRGNDGNDVLDGKAGNDTLYDGAGNDTLRGGDGNDFLVREDFAGKDVFDGGAGTDTLSFDFSSSVDISVKLDLTDSTKNDGLARGLTVTSIENVVGSELDDNIAGSTANEQLSGGYGGDVLNGRGGNDTLIGGLGADQLTGGSGNDTFRFDDLSSGGDFVTDFQRGQDKLAIDLDAFDLASNYALKLVVSADPVASGSGPIFMFESDTHRLWFDADGAGGDEEMHVVATLDNITNLSASDFLFV